jgi:hypothetical protein
MDSGEVDFRAMARAVIEEFLAAQKAEKAPQYQAELAEEKARRESLEQRINELIAENSRSKAAAAEAERGAAIRAELQRLGVVKIDLAYKAVKDDLGGREGVEMREYLAHFAAENPEFLPARLAGGSGAGSGQKTIQGGGVDLEQIRPGMSPEEMERVRQEIARVASQALRGV